MESDKIKAYQQLQEYTRRWDLIPEEAFLYTSSSLLQAVILEGKPAMLKIPFTVEERRGANLMTWWAGNGAAKVLKEDSNAILLERLLSNRPTLVEMARNGQATLIICSAAQNMHAIQKKPWPNLVPLDCWFQDLEVTAQSQGGLFQAGWVYAQELLDDPQEITVLHGDLHHGNVLHSIEDGWLVIDPKGLMGERCFDYANLFCNPDEETALAPDRFLQRLELVAKEADLRPERLLKWIVAWGALSATWSLLEGEYAGVALSVAALAKAKLDH